MKSEKINHLLLRWLVVIALVISLLAASYSYQLIQHHQIDIAMERRASVRNLAATLVQERLDRVIDLGNLIVNDTHFKDSVTTNDWETALADVARLPQTYDFIDRVFLADVNGILQVDFPELPGGVRGRDFSNRDWYKGVRENWQPYISEVYKRSAIPQENVIAAAFPIFSTQQETVGILVIQVSLETFRNWTNNVVTNDASMAYIIDQSGQVVAKPGDNSHETIVNISDKPEVKKLLAGETNLEIIDDDPNDTKKGNIVAYQPIEKFGWGVLVFQSVDQAFQEGKETLQTFIVVYGIFLALHLTLAAFILRTSRVIDQQRHEYKTLLKNIGDGVIAIDKNLNVVYVNDAALTMSGFSNHEIIGSHLRKTFKFLKSQSRQETVEFIQEPLITGKPSHPQEPMILVSKDGKEIPIGDTVAPIFDNNQNVTGAIIVFRDTSEEIEAGRTKSSLAYSSHQLRTPVTKALWGLEMALEEKDSLEKHNYIMNSYLAIKSVRKLTDQISEVSQIDQGLVAVKSSQVDLRQIIQDAVATTTSQRGDKADRFITTSTDTPASIKTDPELCKKILAELLDNAATYSDPGKPIHIAYSHQQGGILIEVADQGWGIPEDEQATVFAKFFRGSNFDTTQVVGAGLGLYICKEYVNMLGGKIWFSTKQNKGTTFFVLLPDLDQKSN